MQLVPMRYKSFIWPHNPDTYSITYERKIAAHKAPMGTYCMQDMGSTYRVMRGEGAFAGVDAYEQFKALASVFYQEGAGLLVHPVWQTARAHFVSLALAQKPLRDYVRYTFAFWEDCGGEMGLKSLDSGAAGALTRRAESAAYHTVVRGDTLWAIAQRNGLTLRGLLALNPQIRNPNLIYPGNQVRVK